MFKPSWTIISLVVLGGIASGISYKIHSLHVELEEVTHNLERCTDKVSNLNLEIAIKDGNIKDLNESLQIANSNIEKLTLSKRLVEEEFKLYKEKPLSSKLPDKKLSELVKSNNVFKSTCEYGIKLNSVIKELKYEDL